jgi:serine/threonine protein phosphatase PrpC
MIVIKRFFFKFVVSCAGCTANVAVIYKNTLFVANAGDSRAILCRNGLPLPLS